jgi:hypothetical protein
MSIKQGINKATILLLLHSKRNIRYNNLMRFLNFLTTHILIFSLTLNTSAFAKEALDSEADAILQKIESNQTGNIQNFIQITDSEKVVLKHMGLTPEEINELSENPIDGIKNIKPKVSNFLENEKKKGLEVLNTEVIPGFATSLTSMAFASFLGITLVLKCRSQPSAMVFSGASALWIASELANWNGYKIKIDNIDKFGTPNEDLAAEQEKLMIKIKELSLKVNKLIKDLKVSADILREVKTLDDLDKLKDNTEGTQLKLIVTEVLSLRENIKILKAQYKVFFDEQYLNYKQVFDSMDQIKETTKTKARNTKLAATGFALASALAFAEHFNIIKGNGACFAQVERKTQFSDLFISTAYAAETVKEKEQNKFVKNNLYDGKTAQISSPIANLDKIGILAGGGMAAAYLGFKMKFLNKILASGMSRGIVFGILAGMAYFSGLKLGEFSDYLQEKLTEVEDLRTAISERLHIADKALDDIITFMSYVNLTVIPFIDRYIDKVQEDVDDYIDDLPQTLIDQEKDKLLEKVTDEVKDDVKEDIQEIKEELENVPTEDIKSDLEDKVKDITLPVSYNNQSKEINMSELPPKNSFINMLMNTLFQNVTAATPAKQRLTSCYTYANNFLTQDTKCICRKSNSCITFGLPNIKNDDSKLSNFLTSSTQKYMSNVNGYLNGHGDVAMKRLEGLTKENG